ncbi:MAG TPA: alpha/beta fold hydrolase [Steroidobacteraceae bacterium]|nr:alpha/beta fold hydrolase [Steroidobacteraceae bacterium]
MIHAKHRNRLPLPQPAVVHVRRSYAESRYGQTHIWTAYPSGGGFDERTPVVCLHHAGGSARLFGPILRELGHDRSIYAPDLPGHGTSDAPNGKFSVADIAGSVMDFLDSLRLRQVDVFGYQFGAQVAAELAIARPQQVRRVMLWGVPTYSAQDRVSLLQPPAPLGSREDGSDVAEEWRRMMERKAPNASTASLAEELSDRLRSAHIAAKAHAASVEYVASERLPLMKQPTLVLRVKDEHWEQAPRVRGMLPNGSLLDLPDQGAGILSASPQRFSSIAREYLDR